MPSLPNIQLEQTMLHELPRGRKREDGSSRIVYSVQPTQLDPRTDRFIREEMLQPFVAGSREIAEASDGRSPIPTLVKEVFNDPAKLPTNSKIMADWMHQKQWGASSDGVFLASLAMSEQRPCFVILKAEHQEGVRLKHSGSDDAATFQVEHLTELIMGQRSQVYKIAIFWMSESAKLLGLMVDKQNGVGYADFFLTEFLGCELTHPAEKLTQTFVKGLEKFINLEQLGDEKRAKYAAAAVAVLDSPNPKLNPARFIQDFIEPEDRDLAQEVIGTSAGAMEFRKDTTLVRGQIGGLLLRTDSHVTIAASHEALTDGTVVVEPDGENGPRVVVNGLPDNFKLSKKPK